MLQILQQFDGKQVRIIQQQDGPWFNLSDLCRVLGMSNPSVVASRLEENERAKLDLGGANDFWAVNESGLYAVIFRSDKPVAQKFRHWVTGTVLPELRKTGQYTMTPAQPDFSALERLAGITAQAIEVRVEAKAQEVKAELRAEVDARFGDLPIQGTQVGGIYRRGQRLGELMGGGRRERGAAWRSFNQRFGLASYRDLPARLYGDAVTFLDAQITAYDAPATLKFG